LHLHNSIGKPKLIGKTYTKAREASVEQFATSQKTLEAVQALVNHASLKKMSAMITITA
jgi:hypothetical protein